MRRRLLTLLLLAALAAPLVAARSAHAKEPPFALPPEAEVRRLRSAVLFTNKGKIRFELYPEDAPWHVANLKYLADKGFYRNLKFHLFHPGYIIQGGAPSPSDPNSGPGYDLPPEVTLRRHEEGVLGMGRLPEAVNPERRSHGSQFHILLGDAPKMDSAYTIFGKITAGMTVLRELQLGDTIEDFKVYVRRR